MYVYRTGYLQFRIIPGIHWGDQVWDTMLYERPLASLKLCPESLNFVQKIIKLFFHSLLFNLIKYSNKSDLIDENGKCCIDKNFMNLYLNFTDLVRKCLLIVRQNLYIPAIVFGHKIARILLP